MTDQTIPITRPFNLVPESPWAQHFYPSHDPLFRQLGDGLHHSGLAPARPYVPWDQLGQIPQNEEPLPSTQNLDFLFYAERYQRIKRSGMMSWRLPAMIADLYDLSKRNDIEMDPNLIQVNEDGWLDFLKRSKWFDRRVDALSSIPNPHPDLYNHPNNWWTVDNPAIWRIVRIALEMVNRVLNTIIESRHPWLDTVLFSQLQKWSDIDPTMAAHCAENQNDSPGVMTERPASARATAAEMRAALNDALRFCVLSFVDEASVTQGEGIYGYSAFGFTYEAAGYINKMVQGDVSAVAPALQTTRNLKNLPLYVKKPQDTAGNPVLTGFEDFEGCEEFMPIEDLVAQAVSQTPGPDDSVMDAAAIALAALGPISGDEFKMDPVDTLLCTVHVAPLRCLLNTESKPFERYNALMSMAVTVSEPPNMRRILYAHAMVAQILHELSVGFANISGLCLLEY
ncbi:hypothetical protein PG997_008927 [Apiospora hydei]|uniref:Uncharacterized protein n=1 Tax=Apiospora hydei TaxID=1337664 RepID=A0ABR1WG11_9PEZI